MLRKINRRLILFFPTLMFIIYRRNTSQDNDKYNKPKQTKLPPNLDKAKLPLTNTQGFGSNPRCEKKEPEERGEMRLKSLATYLYCCDLYDLVSARSNE